MTGSEPPERSLRLGADRARRALGLSLVAALLVLPRIAPATVAEQRARLPPAAECDDPITGTWKAQVYRAEREQWTEWTLILRRSEDDKERLVGEIINHSWYGGAELTAPPTCERTRAHWVVSTDAEGYVSNGDIHVQGVGEWRKDEAICGPGPGGYNLDHFSGALEHGLHEFQSVNNDGGVSVNEPTVFRRVLCLVPAAEQPRLDLKPPPPFSPPARGCELW
ncbi:hypothetical protein L6R46_01070 [Myxococcota bacterium]|nr:hypothetical protein [Myxococcota bacterium]